VIKIIDDLGSAGVVKEQSPDTLIVGRVSVDYDFDSIRAKGNRSADRHAESFIIKNLDKYKSHPSVDYWEGYNEPMISSAELMADYAAFEAERSSKWLRSATNAASATFQPAHRRSSCGPIFCPHSRQRKNMAAA